VRACCTPPGNQAASAPPGQHCVFQAYPLRRQLSAAPRWTWSHVSSSEAAACFLYLTRRPGCARGRSARAGATLAVPLASFAVAAPAHAAQSQAAVSAVDSAVSALIDIVKVCFAATAGPVLLAGCLVARVCAAQACTLLLCSWHGSAKQHTFLSLVQVTGASFCRPPGAA
jgi:hypothetical protein